VIPVSQLLPFVAFLLSFWRDPRKVRTGLYLLFALGWTALGLVFQLSGAVTEWNDTAGALVLLAAVLLGLLMVVGFAGFLIATGVTLVRREGLRLSHLLSLGLGLALLAYAAAVVAVAVANSLAGFLWLLLIGLPAGYLGFAFTAFLLYGSLYPALMARSGGPVAAVVVLGSGLIDGAVPPLLASRLRKGRTVFDRLAARGTPPRAMVTSGGRGPDEPVAEAEAMADFLVEDGLSADRVLREDRSRNTDENLANTAALLAEQGIAGPIAVVTSDFHAFRAALLMRRHGLAGYAVGAPTARYYWPSAVIREFIAVLRDHLWLNVVLFGLSAVPLVVVLVGSVTAQR
jgi:uncharacterized SAM-binding protein YcdF (DUF218 family)